MIECDYSVCAQVTVTYVQYAFAVVGYGFFAYSLRHVVRAYRKATRQII